MVGSFIHYCTHQQYPHHPPTLLSRKYSFHIPDTLTFTPHKKNHSNPHLQIFIPQNQPTSTILPPFSFSQNFTKITISCHFFPIHFSYIFSIFSQLFSSFF